MACRLGAVAVVVILVAACGTKAPSTSGEGSASPRATPPGPTFVTPASTIAITPPPPASHGPAIGTWTATGSLVNARFEHTARS